MKTQERFVETYRHGIANTQVILVDRETGVNYLMASNTLGAMGICVLVDAQGNPVVTPVESELE
ncbi:DUF6440 family protein [Dubosiella muris]|mgnify:CR=1 FL=1|uniref:Xylan 1,4-beta-xylosidase n=1 Tax=Dubosiella muris TaxID=3038133 RepID=A0AC61R681_9FIRM|nr:DUF6440 family protein [Dubosiella muris]TGY65417.1 xylan 1,4-beta-xylosidase [Dubosiella muris]